jgi:hypothetical protein
MGLMRLMGLGGRGEAGRGLVFFGKLRLFVDIVVLYSKLIA